MEKLLRNTVSNMCWMAQMVHQAHHFVADDPSSPSRWQDCSKGICGSMEHMLAQAGFDKELNRVEVRP